MMNFSTKKMQETQPIDIYSTDLLHLPPRGVRTFWFGESRFSRRQGKSARRGYECGCPVDGSGNFDTGWPTREDTPGKWYGSVVVLDEDLECHVHLELSAYEACAGHGLWTLLDPDAPRADGSAGFGCRCHSGFEGDYVTEAADGGTSSTPGCSLPTHHKSLVTQEELPSDAGADGVDCLTTVSGEDSSMSLQQRVGCTGRVRSNVASYRSSQEAGSPCTHVFGVPNEQNNKWTFRTYAVGRFC